MKYTGKLTAPVALKPGKYVTVLPVIPALPGSETEAMVYLRIEGTLEDTAPYGYLEVRALRANGDGTAVQGYLVAALKPGTPGGAFSFPLTHHWRGANPKSFLWQVRIMQGIKSAKVTTRYAKMDDDAS